MRSLATHGFLAIGVFLALVAFVGGVVLPNRKIRQETPATVTAGPSRPAGTFDSTAGRSAARTSFGYCRIGRNVAAAAARTARADATTGGDRPAGRDALWTPIGMQSTARPT